MSADAPNPPAAANADPDASRYEQTSADVEGTNYVGSDAPAAAGQTPSRTDGGGGDPDLPRRFGHYELRFDHIRVRLNKGPQTATEIVNM